MKVKLLVPICGPEGSLKAGEKPNLPEILALALIKDGNAESIEEKVIESPKEGEKIEPESDNTADNRTNHPSGSQNIPKGGRNRR